MYTTASIFVDCCLLDCLYSVDAAFTLSTSTQKQLRMLTALFTMVLSKFSMFLSGLAAICLHTAWKNACYTKSQFTHQFWPTDLFMFVLVFCLLWNCVWYCVNNVCSASVIVRIYTNMAHSFSNAHQMFQNINNILVSSASLSLFSDASLFWFEIINQLFHQIKKRFIENVFNHRSLICISTAPKYSKSCTC